MRKHLSWRKILGGVSLAKGGVPAFSVGRGEKVKGKPADFMLDNIAKTFNLRREQVRRMLDQVMQVVQIPVVAMIFVRLDLGGIHGGGGSLSVTRKLTSNQSCQWKSLLGLGLGSLALEVVAGPQQRQESLRRGAVSDLKNFFGPENSRNRHPGKDGELFAESQTGIFGDYLNSVTP